MKRPDDTSASTPEGAPAPFRPPVRDPGVLALLKGLNPAPEPVETPTAVTDGELVARFAGDARLPPPAGETPAPESSVVVQPTPAQARPAKPKKGEKLDTTFRLRPSRTTPVVPVAAAVLASAALAVWLLRAPTNGSGPSPTQASRAPSRAAPETTAYPDIPPPPPAETVAPSEPVHASPPVRPTTSAPTPAKSKPPSRPKEDEPERTL